MYFVKRDQKPYLFDDNYLEELEKNPSMTSEWKKRIEEGRAGLKEAANILEFEIENYEETEFQGEPGLDYGIFIKTEFNGLLRILFADKCAYCETPIKQFEPDSGIKMLAEIDCFRPRFNAVDLNGKIDKKHYWWLAYDWDNLYLSCPDCYASKSTRFPVKNGIRLEEDQSPNEGLEIPLLMDPCNPNDFPPKGKQHLVFQKDGNVVGVTEKGKTTIDVLGLNRTQLIKDRKIAVKEFLAICAQIKIAKNENKNELVTELEEKKKECLTDSFRAAKEQALNPVTATLFHTWRLSTRLHKQLHRIKVHNFKNLEHVDITFSEQEDKEPWLVLLGDNGVGKSNLLQAIAIALMGTERAEEIRLDASLFFNFDTNETVGNIILEFKTGETIQVNFDHEKKEFEHFLKDKNNQVIPFDSYELAHCGFGPMRLFSHRRLEKVVEEDKYDIQGLFNPYSRPIDYIEWVADEKNIQEENFLHIAIGLKELLRFDKSVRIERKMKGNSPELYVVLSKGTKPISLRVLSSGYQSILFLYLGIVKQFYKKWNKPALMEGIVLLDEIGTHLHPEWKMKIVKQLRYVFERITFIVSTHEPLCLRGIKKGEIALMDIDKEDQIRIRTDLPNPETLRIGQLLIAIFGLDTTLDPDLNQDINRFLQLKSDPHRSEKDQREFEDLRRSLENKYTQQGHLNASIGFDLRKILFEKTEIDNYKELIQKEKIATENLDKNKIEQLKNIWRKKLIE